MFHVKLNMHSSNVRSRDSAVSTATGYRLDDEGSEFKSQLGQEFSFLHIVQTGSGAHPASQPMGTGGSSLGFKQGG
jgi:hypothetical protein